MSKYPDKLKEMFGIKSDLTINFIVPKKALVRYDNKEKLIENLTYINIMECPNFTSIELGYKVGDVETMESTACQNYEGITILD